FLLALIDFGLYRTDGRKQGWSHSIKYVKLFCCLPLENQMCVLHFLENDTLAVMVFSTIPHCLLFETVFIPSPESKEVFAKEQQTQSKVEAVAGSSATLSCELAQAQTEVTWYKDGKKLSPSQKVHVEAKGRSRQLVVQQAGKADAGEYTCEAGGQKVTFHLDVKGQHIQDIE
uniref:Ig-like domain-containing protein n=1 Tax=Vombatus ursinus TaxID=29139 RepID=A0A4X2KQ36_VOMUR